LRVIFNDAIDFGLASLYKLIEANNR
jgi:hypothetical protein